MESVWSLMPSLLGGVGLFLLGMILMTDGLKAAAGGSMQRVLERSTGTPLSAFLSGVGMTALVQSSSATTIATIGFVSAGLLSFPAAIGVVIGANVGTTSTGWIVSLLGFKLNVGMFALPLVGVGALARLLGSGRRRNLGLALAGFGLIFVGIDFLRTGMGGLAQHIDLSGLSGASFAGRLALVAAGFAMTVLLQSSSAAVALTLTALHGGAVDLPQAAYLVIGQNLGTTVTAVLASAGASVPARRTALAHILFNAGTGFVAFFAAPWLLAAASLTAAASPSGGASLAVALFHTAINLIGTALFLPFTRPFARRIVRLIPDRGPAFTRYLDRSLLDVPSVALEAAARSFGEMGAETLDAAAGRLQGRPPERPSAARLSAVQAGLREARGFLADVRLDRHQKEEFARRLRLLHASDHLNRLAEALREPGLTAAAGPVISETSRQLASEISLAAAWTLDPGGKGEALTARLAETSRRLTGARQAHRAKVLARTASGDLSPDAAQAELDAMQWIDKLAYHAWRAMHHLAGPGPPTDPAAAGEPEVGPEPEGPASA